MDSISKDIALDSDRYFVCQFLLNIWSRSSIFSIGMSLGWHAAASSYTCYLRAVNYTRMARIRGSVHPSTLSFETHPLVVRNMTCRLRARSVTCQTESQGERESTAGLNLGQKDGHR